MKRLSGAIVGYGFIAERGHTPGYLRQGEESPFEIIAVADLCEARRRAAKQAFPNARIYPDHGSLLAAEASRLDFVDIATPPAVHASIALDALKARLHVLCEKPMATTLADAEAMVRAAKDIGAVLFPSHNYKHAPVIRAVKNVLAADEIGEVSLVTLQTFRNTHARGVGEWRPDWRRERAFSGGGIAMDHGSHTFYLAFDWLGDYPTSITAKMSTLGDHDTEDNFSSTMTFPRGIAVSHLSWTAGMRRVIYTLHGTRGAIRVEDDQIEVSTLLEGGLGSTVRAERIPSAWMDASHVSWFESLLDQFREAILTRDFVGKEVRDALECVRAITIAYASAVDGCRELPLRDAGHRL